MKYTLKPLNEQVVVITGASSGIGLVTAKAAAAKGARVVLAARNEADLGTAVAAIKSAGGRAIQVVADVASVEEVDRILDTALAEFGAVDTWVNNAAVAMYGLATELDIADMRRQFDVTYWGQVYGSRAAIRAMGERGGALINVASTVADRAIPLQANYCAAKHAIKGFTDSLRMELEANGIPISVTLIKPASIDTPFFDKARTRLGVEPQPVPPVYAPEIVANAILRAAEHPMRDVIAGGAGKLMAASSSAPRLTDRYMERTLFDKQRTDRPSDQRPDNLYAPVAFDGGERGANWTGSTKEKCLYTSAVLHPGVTLGALGALSVALLAATPLLLGRWR